jgi:hypothetical protein
MKYTLLLKNGRVIDPAGNIDTFGDVGIRDGRIVDSGKALEASEALQVVDVRGRWIIPGVIDPHMHVSSWIGGAPGLRMMAKEGVVTALDMAGPVADVIENIRNHGSGMNILCLDAFTRGEEEPGKVDFSDGEIEDRLGHSLEEGAYGVKLLGGHYPLTPDTTRRVIQQAAENGMYIAFHAGTTEKGSNLEGFEEALALADGHPVHIAHINSYCRGAVKPVLQEVQEALELLERHPNVWSESYLSPFNGTSGKCERGRILSHVTGQCCLKGGYSPDEKGLGEAIRGGFARVVAFQAEGKVHVTGEQGYSHWKERQTDVTLSFPVNALEAQIVLATAKDRGGRFRVDALSTDGGGIPRNTMIRQGLDLCRFGAFSPSELVRKLSVNAADMLGLETKGHLAPGADGDITVLDPDSSRAWMSLAMGRIIMIDGVVTGSGGTLITTPAGKGKVQSSGVFCTVADPKKALTKKGR